MRAKDIMRKKVVTVAGGMTIRELAKLFMEERISGAPVVDANKKLLGVVSQTDLVRHEREAGAERAVPAYYRDHEEWVLARGMQLEDPSFARVEDIMTPAVLSADEMTPVEELAKTMLRRRIHRLVITKGGRLSGIVTTTDMLKVVAQPAPRKRVSERI